LAAEPAKNMLLPLNKGAIVCSEQLVSAEKSQELIRKDEWDLFLLMFLVVVHQLR
jgi:hypothetical protein